MDKPDLVSRHLARNLATLRQVRSLTQDGLAKAAGVPRSTIANLESGDGNPSLGVLVKVARALSTSLDELTGSPRAKVRRWSAKDLASRSRGRGVTTRDLVPEAVPEEVMELMEFAPGGVMPGTPHLPGTREYFSCLEGKVTIFVAGDRFELDAGDVLGFPGNVPHSYRNTGNGARAVGVSVVVLAKAGY
ncbi:MAG TPA: XRE family transcriptional regulator [Usitatibacter sp.]|nr:XRE family transcriptional regulator [Usitatibacter sp.]